MNAIRLVMMSSADAKLFIQLRRIAEGAVELSSQGIIEQTVLYLCYSSKGKVGRLVEHTHYVIGRVSVEHQGFIDKSLEAEVEREVKYE